MPISSDELSQLRQGGLSDDQIVQGLTKTDPGDVPDIQALQKHGLNSTQILDGFAKYNQDNQPKESWGDVASNFAKAIGYGVEGAAGGAASTEGNVLGAPSSVTGAEQGVSDLAKSAIGNYDPAGPHVSVLHPSTWSYIPRAVAESLPDIGGAAASGEAAGLIGDLIAPEVAVPAQLLGMGAYWLNRRWGQNAQQRAAMAGHPNNVTSADAEAALPGSLASAALNTVGTGKLLAPTKIEGAGLEALPQIASNIGKTAATNAATMAGSTASDEVAGGQPLNPSDIANSAFTGGVGAGLLKTVGSPADLIQSKVLAGGNARIKQSIADDLNSDRISGDPNSPKDNERMLASAGTLYNKDISDNLSGVNSQAKDLESQNLSASHIHDAVAQAKDMLANLKNGTLDPSQVKSIEDNIAPVSSDLSDNLQKLNELNALKQRAGVAIEKASQAPTIYDKLRAAHVFSHYLPFAAGGGIAAHALGNPVWMGITAAPFALAAARKIGTTVSGSGDPVGTFVRRFSGLQKVTGAPIVTPEGNTPDPTQALPAPTPEPPTAPLNGQLLPPPARPAGLLPAPPIYGQAPDVLHGDNFVASRPFTPPAGSREPIVSPLALQGPRRALPAPNVTYGPETAMPAMPFPWQRQTTAPAFTMRPSEPQAAPVRTAPVQQPAPEIQQPAFQAPPPVIPKRPITLNDQADQIEQTIRQSQAAIADPSASADVKAAARLALIKAAMAGANMQQATSGGAKSVRTNAAFNPEAQRVPNEHIGKPEHVSAHEHHSGHASEHKTERVVEPKTIHIKTEHGTRVQAVSEIRKSPDAIASGYARNNLTRSEIAKAATKLPLSSDGVAKARTHADDLISASNGVSSQAAGRGVLENYLSHFSPSDRAVLAEHYAKAKASTGMHFLDSWGHKTDADVEVARLKNAAYAKRKATRAKNREKNRPGR